MTNKIIAQSARFRAVRTSRDRVRIKSADGKAQYASLVKCASGFCVDVWDCNRPTQDMMTFIEAVHRTLNQEGK